ncbi:MAG: DNA adenine methylase [Clostridia bacterium]
MEYISTRDDKKIIKSTKPFLKWAGGKGQLLSDIRKSYPKELGNKINKYAEPMVGGGAVLFDILSNYQMDEVYINDINIDLINAYKTVKEQVKELIKLLEVYQFEYVPMKTEDRKEYYYDKRDRFNAIKLNGNKVNVEKAALLIFLNKTCFNGLYRVNKSGGFNVPMGAYKNPCICDKENLINVSKALQNVTIHCGEYTHSEEFIDKNTFVYIDPPYRPLSETSSFTSYNESEFGDKEQIELSEFANILKSKKAKVVLSNSDPKNADENDNFFDEIYKEFVIKRVKATRMISSKSSSRGKINELLIANY